MSTTPRPAPPSAARRAAPVVRLRAGEHHQGAAALVASHADYPAFQAVFADPDRRARALRAFFATTVRDGIAHGAVDAVRAEGSVQGVAVWLPPGGFPWTAARKLRATPALLQVAAADPGAFVRFARYGANTEQAHPAEAHWYLVVLGIRPAAQRSGLGSRLIEPALARADRDRLPVFLETSDPANVAFYRRFGFEVVDDALRLVPDGPTHIAMRRPPRAGKRGGTGVDGSRRGDGR